MNEERRNAQITETNQRILNCCAEIIRKLAMDPEAHISDVVLHMGNVNTSRSTQIREKHKELRDACDRYEGRHADALA